MSRIYPWGQTQRERERERKGQRERERDREREIDLNGLISQLANYKTQFQINVSHTTQKANIRLSLDFCTHLQASVLRSHTEYLSQQVGAT